MCIRLNEIDTKTTHWPTFPPRDPKKYTTHFLSNGITPVPDKKDAAFDLCSLRFEDRAFHEQQFGATGSKVLDL